MEESVQGECLTEYTIHKLPQFKINELEEAWRMEELKVKDFNIESESEAKTTCEGKPYFLITKTKNFEQCKKTPFFQMITRDSIANSDVSKPNELMSVMSSTNIYVCGELNEFTVRKISHKRIAEHPHWLQHLGEEHCSIHGHHVFVEGQEHLCPPQCSKHHQGCQDSCL